MNIAVYIALVVAIAVGWFIGRLGQVKEAKRTRSSQDIFQDYFVGLNYLLNDEPDEAIDTFIKALEVNNDTVETHLALGTLLRRRGKVDKAITVHQSLLARSGLDAEFFDMIRLELAKDYIFAGLLDRAERLLDELVVGKSASKFAALHGLITIYQLEKEWENAINCCSSLLRNVAYKHDVGLRSSAAHYCCELAVEAQRQGLLAEARKQVKRAFTYDRRSVRASLLLASIEEQAQNYQAAIKELLRVQSNRPEFFTEIAEPLRRCYEAVNDIPGFEKFLLNAVHENAETSALFYLGEFKKQQQGHKAAVEYLQAELKTTPSIQGLLALLELEAVTAEGDSANNFRALRELVMQSIQNKNAYLCGECGFESRNMYWQCPSCKIWDRTLPMSARVEIDAHSS